MIVDDHAAVAVQDFAARSKHRDGLDAVLHGAFLVERGITDLQIPEAGDQEQKDRDHKVLEESDFAGRELAVVAQKLIGRNLLMFAVVPQFHKQAPGFKWLL